MTNLEQTYQDFKVAETDNQIISLWERHENRIKRLIPVDSVSDLKYFIGILELLTKAQNKKELYSSIYYIYKFYYKPINQKLIHYKLDTENAVLELEFQLARGLHFNRKYSASKELFNDLAKKGFDIKRFDDWWDQSAFASSRDKYWFKVDILPGIIRVVLIGLFMFTIIQTKEIIFTSAIFIILFESLEYYGYNLKLNTYLKDYIDLPETLLIKQKAKRAILIEFIISLLFYPIYFLNQDWLNFIVIGLIVYMMAFSYGFSFRYLPNMIGELNRKQSTAGNTGYTSGGF
jgi:hypothetical protein